MKPLPSEIIGGIATKSFPLVTSVAVYWSTVGLAHPVALTGLIALSVTQEVFLGFYLKSWNNFQESLRRARGFNYQMFFNLAYMQGFGFFMFVFLWVRASFPRYRYDQIMRLGWKVFIPITRVWIVVVGVLMLEPFASLPVINWWFGK